MDAATSDDEETRLSKLASKISRYMEKDRDDKLRTVLDTIRDSKHSLEALDSSGVGKLVKKLSKRDDSVGRLAGKIIKKWKKRAERSEIKHAHASAANVHSESTYACDVDRAEKSNLHNGTNDTGYSSADSRSKLLTQEQLAEAERMDPAYAAILQKLYASSSDIPDADDAENSSKSVRSSHDDLRTHHPRNEFTKAQPKQSNLAANHCSIIASRLPANFVSRRAAPAQNISTGGADFEITRATGHSQIYSGSRRHTAGSSPRKARMQQQILSLQNLCLLVMKENINLIGELGGPEVAYHIIKPVLEACDAQQLSRIEEANPHLYIDGDTNELWKRHVLRDFPKADVANEFMHKRRKRKRSFTNSSDDEDEEAADSDDDEEAESYVAWRDVYAHQVAERERNFQRITARIQQNKRDRTDPVKRTMTAEIIGSGARAPREVRRAQLANVDADAPAGVFRGGASALARQIVANSGGGSETITATSRGTNAASDSVVKITALGGPRNQQQKAHKRVFAPLMARSLKMLKR